MIPKTAFLIVALSVASITVANAQISNPLQRLHNATTIHCTFPVGVVAEWKDTTPKINKEGFGSPLIFDQITPDSSRARFVGNNGAVDVWAQANGIGLHFLEQVPAGGLNLTTVFGEAIDPGTANYRAVHSRHVVPFEPLPSQYYGTCRISG